MIFNNHSAIEETDAIEDLLIEVEDSFQIRFEDNELIYIETMGQLCDHIANKIQLEESEDCTSQQAFYKLTSAFSSVLQFDKGIIKPGTQLAEILPRRGRKGRLKKVEAKLGFSLQILRPPVWVSVSLLIILLLSPLSFFYDSQTALLGLMASFGGFWLSAKLGREFTVQTVGQAAVKMKNKHYMKSRRNSVTVNKGEIEAVLSGLFSEGLGVEKEKIGRETLLIKRQHAGS